MRIKSLKLITAHSRTILVLFLIFLLFAAAIITLNPSDVAANSCGWYWQNPLPSMNNYKAMWGTASDDLFLVCYGGGIFRYNGSTGTPMTLPRAGLYLSDIWGSGNDNVFVTGTEIILHFDGTSWSDMPLPSYAYGFQGIWGASATSVYAVSLSGFILHYDGTSWTTSFIGGGGTRSFQGIWGSSESDVFAVGGSSGSYYIYHYDGSTWTEMVNATGGKLYAIWGTASNNVFACGDSGRILRYDGSSWSAMNSGVSFSLYDVWGSVGDGIFCVSVDSTNNILHYAGSGNDWTAMDSGGYYHLRGVFGVGGTVYAMGDQGVLLKYSPWNKVAPTSIDTGYSSMNGIWGTGSNNVFAVGSNSRVYRYDGATWSNTSSGVVATYNGIWGSDSSNVFAVGDAGSIHRYNGTSWSRMHSFTTETLYAVWGNSASDVYAVGGTFDFSDDLITGIILHYDANIYDWWVGVYSSNIQFKDIWGTSPSNIYAVGCDGNLDYGVIYHFDGSSWEQVAHLPTESGTTLPTALQSIWGISANDIFAGGLNGPMYHYDGSSWQPMGERHPISGQYPQINCTDIWGSSGTDVFCVGLGGDIYHYNGNPQGNWGLMQSYCESYLYGVWGSSGTNVFAVGEGSTILHFTGPCATPAINVVPTSVDFGIVNLYTTNTPTTVTVNNTGGTTLFIDSINLYQDFSTEFNITNDNCTGSALEPGESATFQVTFSPFSVGSRTANLMIHSNDPYRTNTVIPLSGYGQQTSAQVATATGTGIATFSTSSGSIINLTASATTSCGSLSGVTFPHGFFSFTITNITPGSTVTITITFPSNVPANTQYWKCINGQWVDVTSLIGDNDGDNVLTLTITDGGLGDADGQVNGVITDPGGPATRISTPTTVSSDSDSSSYLPERIVSAPARISVKYLTVQPQQALANQPITVYFNIANSGDEAGSYKATLKINGQVEETRTGRVGSHAAVPLKFEVLKDKPGTYSLDINGQQSSFTILDDVGNKVKPTKDWAILGFIVCAMGVLVVSVLLIQRRRSEC